MEIDPGEVLSEARKAFNEEDYSLSLEKYKWFYDNAIRINESYYGVRLSYCLDEWAERGRVFPDARSALNDLKIKAGQEFDSTRSYRSFHEFASICRSLDCASEPRDKFLLMHGSDKELAARLFTIAYETLAEDGCWDICREYLGSARRQYERVIEMFDHLMEFSEKRGGEQGQEIRRDGLEQTQKEMVWLLNIFNNVDASSEYQLLIKTMKSDLEQRRYGDLYASIMDSAPSKLGKAGL